MITIDSSKFKPHNTEELQWLTETTALITKAIEENQLPFDGVRIGRQVKAYGSTGVSSYKNEVRNGKVNVWINGHHRCDIEIDRVIKHMVRSTCGWKHITGKTTEEQKTFLKIKFGV